MFMWVCLYHYFALCCLRGGLYNLPITDQRRHANCVCVSICNTEQFPPLQIIVLSAC